MQEALFECWQWILQALSTRSRTSECYTNCVHMESMAPFIAGSQANCPTATFKPLWVVRPLKPFVSLLVCPKGAFSVQHCSLCTWTMFQMCYPLTCTQSQPHMQTTPRCSLSYIHWWRSSQLCRVSVSSRCTVRMGFHLARKVWAIKVASHDYLLTSPSMANPSREVWWYHCGRRKLAETPWSDLRQNVEFWVTSAFSCSACSPANRLPAQSVCRSRHSWPAHPIQRLRTPTHGVQSSCVEWGGCLPSLSTWPDPATSTLLPWPRCHCRQPWTETHHQRSLSAVQADVWTSLAMSAATSAPWPTRTSHNPSAYTATSASIQRTQPSVQPNSSSPIKQNHPPLFPPRIDPNLELPATLHSTRTAPSSPSPAV